MTAFDLLIDYEHRATSGRHQQLTEKELAGRWSGIAFRLGDDLLVTRMQEIVEIIDPPVCSRVPGAQSWFMGIANVRGNLLPVTDLHGFVFGGRASGGRNARLLVHNANGIYAGVKVDDILGMKQFVAEDANAAPENLSAGLKPFVEQSFNQQGQNWPVFSFTKFTSSHEFLHIAK